MEFEMARQGSLSTLIGGCRLMLRVATMVCLVGLGGAWLKEKSAVQITNPAAPANNILIAGLKVNFPF
jgi:hypothetical protein